MLRLVTQKIKNRLALSLSLLLGIILIVAIFSCKPVFSNAALDRLLNSTFTGYIEDNNRWPVILEKNGVYDKTEYPDMDDAIEWLSSYRQTWMKYLDYIDTTAHQEYFYMPEQSAQGSLGSKGNYLSVTYAPDMEEHIKLLIGTFGENEEVKTAIPCIISEGVMDTYKLCIDETLEFNAWKDASGEPLRLYISGIFKEADAYDLYWNKRANEFENGVFVSKDGFQTILDNYECPEINYSEAVLLDYKDITQDKVEDTIYYLEQFGELDKSFNADFKDMLVDFRSDRSRIDLTLWVLQLPILGMLLAFIYMVSNQIVQTEQDEIAALKSRGFSRKQVAAVYMLQLAILELAGLIVGTPLGVVIARAAHVTTDFLTFNGVDDGACKFTPVMLLYGLAAVIISFLFVLIPVVINTRVSIVERKSDYKKGNSTFIEKYFIDVVLLAASIYLMINYRRQAESIRAAAIAGTRMDPLMFIDAVLFLLAVGLVMLRITHYLVILIYKLFGKHFGAAGYASFLQITRNFGRQCFISVFLILTVALGLFHANIARTINQNNEERIVYDNGADVTFQENWEMEKHMIMDENGTKSIYNYIEPDYEKYNSLISEGLCESITRVIENDNIQASAGANNTELCYLQAINTKEFGETAFLNPRLYGDNHWYNHLNELSQKSGGVIISSNLAEKLSVGIGDKLNLKKYSEIPNKKDEVRATMSVTVCDIVDSWPGFSQYYYEDGNLMEKYLIVGNYSSMVAGLKLSPYSIWCKLKAGVTENELKQAVTSIIETSGTNSYLKEYKATSQDIERMKEQPMIQITNGMFTLSFVVALLLCMTGFLIYWITAIRQRELLFGVYRAMGMSVGKINYMLVNEHIFSTLFSVVTGAFAGMLASTLFANLFALVYLPQKHNLPIYMCFRYEDIVKLGVVIFAMIIICLLILRHLVKSMNITQALKLGED